MPSPILDLVKVIEDILEDPEITQNIPKRYQIVLKIAVKVLHVILAFEEGGENGQG